jgi:hypothetical protein
LFRQDNSASPHKGVTGFVYKHTPTNNVLSSTPQKYAIRNNRVQVAQYPKWDPHSAHSAIPLDTTIHAAIAGKPDPN